MVGDSNDMASRMQAVLPARWFGDSAPLLQAVLVGIGTCWSTIYSLIESVQAQARIATASGVFLDLISADFFGLALPRRNAESDGAFRLRIDEELFRPRATRSALMLSLTELTGVAPRIFEPARPADTGGYTNGGVGYGVAGGWGSLALPYQFFVTAFRPLGGGIALLAGYGSGGIPVYGNLSMVATAISDADIERAVTQVLPAASIAWMNISG